MTARVVLAYSGGLDTSVAIPYLAKMTGGEVIAVSLDLGQGGEDMEAVPTGVCYFPPAHRQAPGRGGPGARWYSRIPRLHRQG